MMEWREDNGYGHARYVVNAFSFQMFQMCTLLLRADSIK